MIYNAVDRPSSDAPVAAAGGALDSVALPEVPASVTAPRAPVGAVFTFDGTATASNSNGDPVEPVDSPADARAAGKS